MVVAALGYNSPEAAVVTWFRLPPMLLQITNAPAIWFGQLATLVIFVMTLATALFLYVVARPLAHCVDHKLAA